MGGGSSIKEILLPCDCRIGLPLGTSLTLKIAGLFGAGVTGLGLSPIQPLPQLVTATAVPSLPVATVVECQNELLADCRARAARTEAFFDELANLSNVPFVWQQHEDVVENLTKSAITSAHYHDLVIVDQSNDESMEGWSDFIERLVLESSRPVLILPVEPACPRFGKTAVVAWDESPAAARAVYDALPLLRRSDTVNVVSVMTNGRDGKAINIQTTSLVAYLRRHGVSVEGSEVKSSNNATSTTLLDYAQRTEADLLVMGGYGRSKWRELIMGSVTQALLSDTRIPVLTSN